MDTPEAVLGSVRRGHSCSVEAAPGAGKTRLLLEMSGSSRRCLILAYNAQLAADITGRLTSEGASCMTFHALCSRCIGMARDDEQMLTWVEAAEAGAAVVRSPPTVDLVLIDEAQDVRSLYARLVVVCGLAKGQVCVVGDRNQLVYDFDEAFPASLDTLLRPANVFPSTATELGWVHHALRRSHRLTRPMVGLVNAMFDEHISSTRSGPPVSVRSPRSMFRLADVLKDLVAGDDEGGDEILLIVDRKKGNRPLRAFLNDCSQRGRSVSVHGIDEGDTTTREGPVDVRCGTFWSTKGMEAPTVVVVLPRAAARNPTYVALTRARARLVVVVDPREPHAAFCQAVESHPEHCALLDDHTRKVVAMGAHGCATTSLTKTPRFPGRPGLGVVVDSHLPSRQAVRDCADWTTVHESVTDGPCDDWGDGDDGGPRRLVVSLEMTTIAVQMALIRCEQRAGCSRAEGSEGGGVVRCVRDILQPTRLDSEQVEASICKGLVSRWIPRNVPEDTVLAPDLREMVRGSCAGDTLADTIVMALGALAWNEFDHVMRKHLPLDTGRFEELVPHVEWLCETLDPTDLVWDTRLVVDRTHCRVHATGSDFCLHVVWESTTNDEAAACLRASLHPKNECRLVELGPRRMRSVVTTSRLYEL